MSERQPILASQRWRIFARDNFTCRYCGLKPPDAVLHCDHVVAVALGGKNTDDNLVTACSTCNGGKGISPLPLDQVQGDSLSEEELQRRVEVALGVKKHFQEVAAAVIDQTIEQALAMQAKGIPVDTAALTLLVSHLRVGALLACQYHPSMPLKQFLSFCRIAYDDEAKD